MSLLNPARALKPLRNKTLGPFYPLTEPRQVIMEDGRRLNAVLDELREGGLSMTLLWQNASPTSEFAAQLLPISLAQNEILAIEHALHSATSGYSGFSFVIVGGKSGLLQSIKSGGSIRGVTATIAGVSFADGYYYNSSWAEVKLNAMCVPLRIYIIRGVQAA